MRALAKRSLGEKVARDLEIAVEALEAGMVGAARICLSAAFNTAKHVRNVSLRRMLLREWARLFAAWALLSGEVAQ